MKGGVLILFVNPFERGEIGPSSAPPAKSVWRVWCPKRPYQAGRSKYRIKVKNRQHPAMERVMER